MHVVNTHVQSYVVYERTYVISRGNNNHCQMQTAEGSGSLRSYHYYRQRTASHFPAIVFLAVWKMYENKDKNYVIKSRVLGGWNSLYRIIDR